MNLTRAELRKLAMTIAQRHHMVRGYYDEAGSTQTQIHRFAENLYKDMHGMSTGVFNKLHPQTSKLLRNFIVALADKLHAAELKYGFSDGWKDEGWMDECRQQLISHVAKGDPLDVAAYCAFLWYHEQPTKLFETNVPNVDDLDTKHIVELIEDGADTDRILNSLQSLQDEIDALKQIPSISE